ncbi:hypothetical protein VP01_871g3 [Puccinia sorghi]|uniref:EXPERA domain-containing protein n=1 Tax=Puccinia sorghi TaxID=27349 RepID=A0A0L6U9F1_9BASI|nr:hypothetical protein VP01_871g3 [Puccinia sorghi]
MNLRVRIAGLIVLMISCGNFENIPSSVRKRLLPFPAETHKRKKLSTISSRKRFSSLHCAHSTPSGHRLNTTQEMAFGSAASRDGLYLGFFLIHAISTVGVEKWPADNDDGDSDDDDDYVIRGTRAAPVYLEIMPDPLMLGARSQDPNYLWFRWFLLHEGLFFLPCFIFGIQGLLKGTASVYPLLLAYAAAASTTTSTCLVVLVFGQQQVPFTSTELMLLLSAYGPFFFIPAVMLVDMYYRVHRLIGPDSFKLKGKKKA